MPQQRRKRPTSLPETVKQRATPKVRSASPLRRVQAVETIVDDSVQNQELVTETRAVLVSDPRHTPCESPTRPAPTPPAPLVHQPEPEPTPEKTPAVEAQSESYLWYDNAFSKAPTPPPRGKVAFNVSDRGFEVCSQGADVAIHYERPQQLPQREGPSDPPPDSLPSAQSPQTDIAPGMVYAACGFLAALFLTWIAVISADRPTIIITPGQSEVIRP